VACEPGSAGLKFCYSESVKLDCEAATNDKAIGLPWAATLWLILAAVSLILFSWLAEEVLHRQSLAFDSAVRNAVHQRATPLLTILMRGLSLLGSADVLLPLVVVALVVMAGTGIRRQAILLVGSLTGAAVLEATLKLVFHRPRPQPFFNLPAPGDYAFPSGHAMVSLCFYITLAWIVSEQLATRWSRVAVWTSAALLTGLIGFSRIYLGVHYPTDVIGGYTAGLVWMASVAKVRNWPRLAAATANLSPDSAESRIAESSNHQLIPAAATFPFPDAGSRVRRTLREDHASPSR
jgi:undecaprenyl-diphosphatase